MSSKKLCMCVRFASVIAAVCGSFLLFWLCYVIGTGTVFEFLGESAAFAWRVVAALSALPCAGVIVCMWAVSNAISRDEVFTRGTSVWIERAAILFFADAPFILTANIIMFFWSSSHPSVLLASGGVTFVFIALGLLAAVLSRYIAKAAELREISEGTI